MAQQRVQPDQYEQETLREMYRELRLIRDFEDRVQELVEGGDIFTDAHLYQGEEAIAVGVCMNLEDGDKITSTHRPHGHILAMGIDPKRVMAEIGGKETGISGGRGGEMHMFDPEQGIIGSNGIVGASIPHAAGAALADQLDESSNIAVGFFGDGGSNQGIIHETMNLAAVWELPVLFVCENNQYAVTTSVSDASGPEHLSDRAAGYGIPGKTIDGQDVLTVYEETKEAVDEIRSGGGPQFIEYETYRYLDHTVAISEMMGDATYRPNEELDQWKARDPVKLFFDTLTDDGIFTEEELQEIDQEIEAEIEAAVDHMKDSAFPPAEDATKHLYQDGDYPDIPQPRYR